MYCKHCGTEIPDDSVFCPSCGKTQVETASTTIQPAVQTVGAAISPSIGVSQFNDLITDGYQVRIGDYFRRGWAVFLSYLGGFIGYSLLYNLIVSFLVVLSIIGIGAIALMLIGGPLMAGFYIVAFKKMKDQPVEFGDFFSGFKYFAPLFLFFLVGGIFISLGTLLLIIPGIYLAVGYIFAVPLIVNRKMEFWDAMETSRKVVTKKWFSVFGFLLLLALLTYLSIGIIGAAIGIIIAILSVLTSILGAILGGLLLIALMISFFVIVPPISSCMLAAAYEGIFGIESTDVT